ncbi:50S ribosomal protein L24 [Candidatus Peribacteria bacterium]|nr:50S ribosomal protein L24 [Candidatus Peribacteria bacterium]
MKIRTGDTVVMITGKDKGKTGTVLRVLPRRQRIVVAGIGMRTRHMPATPQRAGQKVRYEASVHVSNAMLLDPATKKRTRVGYIVDDKGKRRVAKRSGEVIKSAAKAASKNAKTQQKTTKASAAAEDDSKKKGAKKPAAAPAEAQPSLPAKKPFWKRAMSFGEDAAQDLEGAAQESAPKKGHSIPKDTPPPHRSTSRGS